MCEFLHNYGTRVTLDLIKKRYTGYAPGKDSGRGLVDDNYEKAIATCFGWPKTERGTDYEQPRGFDRGNYTWKRNDGWFPLDVLIDQDGMDEHAHKYQFFALPLASTAGVDGFDVEPVPDCPLPVGQAPKRVAPHTPEEGDKKILSLVARQISNRTTADAIRAGTTVPTLAQWMQSESVAVVEPKKYRLPVVAFFAVAKDYVPLNHATEIVQPSRARAKATRTHSADEDEEAEAESKQARSSEDQRSPSHPDDEEDMVVDDH